MSGDKGIVLKCHAGCKTADICAALELRVSDLFDAPLPKTSSRSKIVATYDYTDADGTLKYQVVRKEPKAFLQRQPDPNKPGEWLYKLNGVERVLYNLPAVMSAIQAKKKIFLVEGEKDVESLRAIGLTATTNAGGAAKWQKSYTEILKQATVIIIPDNDPVGREHARLVNSKLEDSAVLELPGLPVKGDVTDWIKAGGTRAALVELATNALNTKDDAPPPPPPGDTPDNDSKYFRYLGHDCGNFFFMPRKSKQVVALSAAGLGNKGNLYALAPLEYWESHPDYMGKSGARYHVATNDLIQGCYDKGIFRNGYRRGRGCWYDNGKIVVHCGNYLVVDGERVDLLDYKSGSVYEQAEPLHIPYKEPLTIEEASQFQKLTEMFSWDSDNMAQLFAGWCAIAPICGVLKWRPHIWVVGPSGSGKSWIMDNVIGKFERLAVKVQSASTEAGIRQALGCDALPVLFDECETEDPKSRIAVQKVLELARQASSENGAVIMKGTTSGVAQQFNIRSAFCMSSVGLGTKLRADVSRFTVLTLHRNPSISSFDSIIKYASTFLSETFFTGLMARSVRLAVVIRKNAETFAVVITHITGDRRLGDQVGHLLAGYWSLLHDSEIHLDDAIKYVKEFGFTALSPREDTKDELQLLYFLMDQRVRTDLYKQPNVERSIAELVKLAANNEDDYADAALCRYGMRIKDKKEGLWISMSHDGIAQFLKNTAWVNNWGVFLKRIDGASETLPKRVRFAGGVQHMAVCVPLAHVMGDDEVVADVVESAEVGTHETQEDIPF